jgi:hypothetical protein
MMDDINKLFRLDTAWRNVIQMNDIGPALRQCGAQQGGEACAFTLWTKLPKAGQ